MDSVILFVTWRAVFKGRFSSLSLLVAPETVVLALILRISNYAVAVGDELSGMSYRVDGLLFL